jgi:DsbC/DsbD-like thiol-disulfide interchange protein
MPEVMRKCLLFVAFAVVTLAASGQIKDPVDWEFSSKKINATTYEVRLNAKLENGWHIYSQTTPDGGPIPTSISFAKNPLITLMGAAKEVGKMEKRFEPLFGVDVKQFSNKVDFVQTVTVKPGIKTTLNGTIEFMTCNDHECMPPKSLKFSLPLQ